MLTALMEDGHYNMSHGHLANGHHKPGLVDSGLFSSSSSEVEDLPSQREDSGRLASTSGPYEPLLADNEDRFTFFPIKYVLPGQAGAALFDDSDPQKSPLFAPRSPIRAVSGADQASRAGLAATAFTWWAMRRLIKVLLAYASECGPRAHVCLSMLCQASFLPVGAYLCHVSQATAAVYDV